MDLEKLGIEKSEEGVIFITNSSGIDCVLGSPKKEDLAKFLARRTGEYLSAIADDMDDVPAEKTEEYLAEAATGFLGQMKCPQPPENVATADSDERAAEIAAEINAKAGDEIAYVEKHGTHPGAAYAWVYVK